MTRRRRAVLLSGLAFVLGGLAASDVARRERELDRRVGPLVPVVVVRAAIDPGAEITPGSLGTRRVPARFAPVGAFASAAELGGARAGAAGIPAGTDVTVAGLAAEGRQSAGAGSVLRRGERIAEVVATGRPDQITPGSRVDVVVTRERDEGSGGESVLALEDVEVLDARPVDDLAEPGDDAGAPGARVAASLRVTVRQAVYLAAAQSFARDVRLLPRAPGDGDRGDVGLSVGAAEAG